MSTITIPNTVTEIGYGAFSSCTNLSSIILSNNIKVIEENMFNGCKNL